jgi:putative hydrolase of the HAD superfamily
MTAGVVFDLDETLIDRQASITRYARRVYHDFRGDIGTSEAVFVERFLQLDGGGYVDRHTFFESLATYVGSREFDSARIAEHFIEHAWQWPVPMEAAHSVCRALRDAGRPLGVVTNGGSRNQRAKLRNSGLDALVDHMVVSEEFGARKPDAAIFMEVCSKLRIDPGKSWFVGDHPQLDIHGAVQVGFRTIWLRRAIPWPADLTPCFTYQIDALTAVTEIILNGAPATHAAP